MVQFKGLSYSKQIIDMNVYAKLNTFVHRK